MKPSRELRGEPPKEEIEPEVLLPVAALLPESYLPDVHQRLLFYKKLAQSQSEEELDELRGELRDVCGEPPAEVDALTALTSLRIAMRRLRLRGLEAGPGRLVLSLGPDAAISSEKLAAKVEDRSRDQWRLTPDMKLIAKQPVGLTEEDLLGAAHRLLQEIGQLA